MKHSGASASRADEERSKDEVLTGGQETMAGIQHLNEELEGRCRALEATNKELEDFIYFVAHDLRAPMRHMDGFSRLLLDEGESGVSEVARGYLHDIRASAVHMGQLLDDLLNLASLGRKKLVLTATALDSLVAEAVMALQRTKEGRHSSPINWKIGKLPSVECDRTLIKRVFADLFSNAVKFARSRSVVEIEVGATTKNGHAVIFVRDNGVGFSMKNATRIFGIFQRLHRRGESAGTGVGLATIRSIVRKHGGDVWAESEVDHGATFFFTLGASRQPVPTNLKSQGATL